MSNTSEVDAPQTSTPAAASLPAHRTRRRKPQIEPKDFYRPMDRHEKRALLDALFARPKVTPGDRAVLLALVYRFHDDVTGECRVPQMELAAFAGVGVKAVEKVIAKYSFAIETHRMAKPNGHHGGNLYRFRRPAEWMQIGASFQPRPTAGLDTQSAVTTQPAAEPEADIQPRSTAGLDAAGSGGTVSGHRANPAVGRDRKKKEKEPEKEEEKEHTFYQPIIPTLSGLPHGLAPLASCGSHVPTGGVGDHPDHPPADAPQLSPANPAGPCGSAADADRPPAGLIVLPSTTPAASAPPTMPATLIPFAPARQKPAHVLAADTPASLTPNPENAPMSIQSPAIIISPAALARILIRYADTVLPIAGSPTRPTLAALGVLTAQPGGISDAEFNAVRVVLTNAGAVLPAGDVMFGDLLAQAGEIARRHRAALYAKRRYKPHAASDIIPADELAPPTEEARLLAMVA